jgi:hypothetical protein
MVNQPRTKTETLLIMAETPPSPEAPEAQE